MNEIIIARDLNQAKRLSRLYSQKKIRRIYKGIYTSNLEQSIEKIAETHWLAIVPHIVTQGILSFRTALELKPIPFKSTTLIFMTSSYNKTITLPGIIIKIFKGNNTEFFEQVLPNIARSNTARMLLENLSPARGELKDYKCIGVVGVENYLAKELRLRHEKRLNQIRDEAKLIASKLGYLKELKKLNQIISALLSTHPDANFLNSTYAKSLAKKQPFDKKRIQLFEEFALYLKKCNFKNRFYKYSKITFRNLTFFETYFSNFIEGTEFIIDEAEDIVFQGREINHRHADSHDILANFTLSNDFFEMNTTPKNADEFIQILQNRHAYLMKERPDKRPGKFKEKPNKVGSSYFVDPQEVIGTLTQGFNIYKILNDGIEKALFMHLLVAEVHPFDDGNGRLSRIMMNAELVKTEMYKIIIPSVLRDNYLNGLRLATRDNNFRIYCKVLDQAQAYSANINWQDYSEARETIEKDFANQSPDEGLPQFNRVIQKLSLSEFAE